MEIKVLFTKKEYWVYSFISLVFIIVNLITFSHLLPWNDEVELTETVLNYIDFGQWTSKAYPEYGGCTPFSMYVPLPQFLQTAWLFVVGTSMYSARSFNLLIVYIIGLVALMIYKNIQKKPLSIYGTAIFATLLWGCGEFAAIYRNGRGDIVGVLVCLLLFLYAYKFVCTNDRKNLWQSATIAAILTWCALQACILVVFCWFFFFVILKNYRKALVKLGIYCMIGFVIGFVLVVGYFAINHHFMAFVHTILGLSSTLKMLAVKALPIVGPMVGLDPAEWAAKVADDVVVEGHGFLGRIWGITDFIAYDILFVICAFLIIVYRRKGVSDKALKISSTLLLLSIFVPIAMNLAGRYVPYYWWMSFIPVLFAVMFMFDELDNILQKSILSISVTAIGVLGIYSMIDLSAKVKYDEWKSLCAKLPIEKNDVVSCPDFTLYDIRQLSDNCYFTKHYELKNMNLDELDYYLQYGPDINTPRNTKKSIEFDNAVMNDTTINLILIERSELLDLNVYRVEHKR